MQTLNKLIRYITYHIRYEGICIIRVGGVFMICKVWGSNPAENH